MNFASSCTQTLLLHWFLCHSYTEANVRFNKHNVDGKSYILDPSWIVDNGMNGRDILPSSFLKKLADSKNPNALSQSSYVIPDSSVHIYDDEKNSGIVYDISYSFYTNTSMNLFLICIVKVITNLFISYRIYNVSRNFGHGIDWFRFHDIHHPRRHFGKTFHTKF